MDIGRRIEAASIENAVEQIRTRADRREVAGILDYREARSSAS